MSEENAIMELTGQVRQLNQVLNTISLTIQKQASYDWMQVQLMEKMLYQMQLMTQPVGDEEGRET